MAYFQQYLTNMPEFKITDEHSIGGDRVFFIAEIGKNFIQTEEDRPVEEYLENAKKLVVAAKEAGADAVKFQTHEVTDEQYNVDVTSPHFKAKDRLSWVTRNTKATPVEEFWKPLKAYCDEVDITFFSTPMSRAAAMKLDEVGVPLWKVGSGDVQDHVTMSYLAKTGKPVIISTGMVSLKELDEVVGYMQGKGIPTVVLYCISQYPCPPEEFNLATLEDFQEKYPDVVIGFSDHSVDSHEVDLAAIKLGAKVVEKHFSFDRELWGADHKASVLPHEFKQMVDDTRSGKYEEVEVEKFYGTKGRELEGAKNIYRPYFNKSLVAGCDIPAGTVITEEMVYAMRPKMHVPGDAADRLHDLVGKKVKVTLKRYDPLTVEVAE